MSQTTSTGPRTPLGTGLRAKETSMSGRPHEPYIVDQMSGIRIPQEKAAAVLFLQPRLACGRRVEAVGPGD